MYGEIPFNISWERELVGTPRPDEYRDVLPLYAEGLLTLAQHVSRQSCDGVLVLGNSASDMWQDLSQVAMMYDIPLPFVQPVEDDGMCFGTLPTQIAAFHNVGITLQYPLIVDDFIDSAKKIEGLHALFHGLGMSVSYAVLYGRKGMIKSLRCDGIDVFSAIDRENSRLLELLKLRKSPRSCT